MDVLLVDDHPIIHETLRAMVRSLRPAADFHSQFDLDAGLCRGAAAGAARARAARSRAAGMLRDGRAGQVPQGRAERARGRHLGGRGRRARARSAERGRSKLRAENAAAESHGGRAAYHPRRRHVHAAVKTGG